MRVWTIARANPLQLPLIHGGTVHHGSFSPDGSRIATGSADGLGRVWRADALEDTCPPLRHQGAVAWVCFSLAGRRVLTASADRTVRLWEAATASPAGEKILLQETVETPGREATLPDLQFLALVSRRLGRAEEAWVWLEKAKAKAKIRERYPPRGDKPPDPAYLDSWSAELAAALLQEEARRVVEGE